MKYLLWWWDIATAPIYGVLVWMEELQADWEAHREGRR